MTAVTVANILLKKQQLSCLQNWDAMGNDQISIYQALITIWAMSFGYFIGAGFVSLNKHTLEQIEEKINKESFLDRQYLKDFKKRPILTKIVGSFAVIVCPLYIIGVLHQYNFKFEENLESAFYSILVSLILHIAVILFFFWQSVLYRKGKLKFTRFASNIVMICETKWIFYFLAMAISLIAHVYVFIKYVSMY